PAATAGVDPALRDLLARLRMTRERFKTFRETWEGHTVVIQDAASDAAVNPVARDQLGVRSCMATPLRVKGRYLGYLYVDQGDGVRGGGGGVEPRGGARGRGGRRAVGGGGAGGGGGGGWGRGGGGGGAPAGRAGRARAPPGPPGRAGAGGAEETPRGGGGGGV